ncbi:ependymin-related protein 2-like [Haliotis cracherodii]|uniref:ependymin-related protein 2-like n=1 Tax=Haliotis cracherodii TaxID=6455 RepID=UPI0039ED0C0E
MLVYLALLSVLPAGLSGGNICCAPDRWAANRHSAGLALVKVEGVNVPFVDVGRSEEYVDAASQRLAIISNFSLEGTQREFKTIADYKKGRKYTIDLKKNTCTVKKLNLPYAKFCIQDSYKKAFDIKLGFGDNSLSGEVYTEDYSGIGPDPNSKIGTAVLVTKECIPVKTDIYGLNDYNLLQSTGFSTYTTDFDDSIFDIPSICPSCSESTATDVPSFDEIRQQWGKYVKV